MYQLWVDFNDVDSRGHVTSLAKYAAKGVSLDANQRLVVGDHEGNLCDAIVVGVSASGLVALTLDANTFRQASSKSAAAV